MRRATLVRWADQVSRRLQLRLIKDVLTFLPMPALAEEIKQVVHGSCLGGCPVSAFSALPSLAVVLERIPMDAEGILCIPFPYALLGFEVTF